MNNQELIDEIDSLSANDLMFVCGRLEEHLNRDEEPVISETDKENLSAENKKFLNDAGAELSLEQDEPLSEKKALQMLLRTILTDYPEHGSAIGEALEELKRKDVKLDFGMSIALAIIVPAIAAAIIRPHLKYSAKKDGKKSDKNFELKVSGIPGIEKILKATLPFLNG